MNHDIYCTLSNKATASFTNERHGVTCDKVSDSQTLTHNKHKILLGISCLFFQSLLQSSVAQKSSVQGPHNVFWAHPICYVIVGEVEVAVFFFEVADLHFPILDLNDLKHATQINSKSYTLYVFGSTQYKKIILFPEYLALIRCHHLAEFFIHHAFYTSNRVSSSMVLDGI